VSIGLYVYNGENFLASAIDSILAQTWRDFELIISDNASTDATEAICREYAAKDDRIRYYRGDRNRGAAWNHNRVFELARGEFFKWAAHDDTLAPEFLERCVAALDAHPEVVLAHTRERRQVYVSAAGKDGMVELGDLLILREPDTAAPEPDRRYHDLISMAHRAYEIFGVIRSDVLRRCAKFRGNAGADKVVLAELALHGPFYKVPEALFLPRAHGQQSVQANTDHRSHAVWFNPANAGKLLFPAWRRAWEYYKCIGRAPLTSSQRSACRRRFRQYLRQRDVRIAMTGDLRFGLKWVAYYPLRILRPAH